MIRNHPDILFAGYQIEGEDNVFGVLKPYIAFGGTFRNTIGIDRAMISAAGA
jgi:hypothetical protein